MANDWNGLHAVVTGGTGALGTAVTEKLLALGATCHIPCVGAEEIERCGFRDHPRVDLVEPVDLRDGAAAADFYAALPPLWASIHCAGGFAMAPIEKVSLADWERLMRLNAATAFLCCREAVKSIRRRGGEPEGGRPAGGRLVNVAARPALEPRTGAGMVAYAMSKAAVAALTIALGEELAGERIWVNAVAPSIIDTPANRDAMPAAGHDRWPTPAAIADTIVFLASPENRSTRSAVVPVYGAA